MNKTFIGLGSNLEQPVEQIKAALMRLAEIPDSTLINASRLYQNPPVGNVNQPDFVNAVAKLMTNLSPTDLLAHLLAIENDHQRVRKEKNGPRTLDLDLLLYGDQIIRIPDLEIPHPRMKERVFVILPLAEIEPELILPCGSPLHSLSADYDITQLLRID